MTQGDDTHASPSQDLSQDPAHVPSGPDSTARVSWVGRARPPAPPPPPVEYPVVDYPALHHHDYPVVELPPGYRVVYPQPRPRGRRSLLVVAGVLAACLAGGATFALLGGALMKAATAPDAAPTVSAATKPSTSQQRTNAPPGLNTPVRDGKFEFVVTSVSCGHSSVGKGFIKREAKGQFCLVKLRVRNIGSENQGFTEFVQKAIGSDGVEYSSDSLAGVIANESGDGLWRVLEPDETVTGTIVYDLPKGERIVKLNLHDSPLSFGVTVTV